MHKSWLFYLCLVVCLSANISQAAKLQLTVANEPPTLDWNLATDNVSYKILNNLMEGLAQYDTRLQPIPALAKSWEISQDGLTYLFHLRSDALWSDGVPLVAKHFLDSWYRLLNPKTAAEYAYFLYDIAGAEAYNTGKSKDPRTVQISAPDPHTLKVQLTHPAVYFPSITTFMVTFPIRLDLISRYGDAWTEAQHMVTVGPFTVKQWRHEYKIVLQKNPRFYGEPKPKLDEVTLFVINEKNTALSLYETGTLDAIDLPPIAIPHFVHHPDYRHQNQLRGYYFGFNVQKIPFQDVRVRQAFSHAINREEFPKILRGGELPATSWIPPGMIGHRADIGLAYDPQKARALLAAAGFPDGKGFPRIRASFNTDQLNRLVAENLQAQWRKTLGVEIILDNQEWKVYLKILQNDPPPLFRLGWGADFPDPDNFMNVFLSYGGNNHTRWKNTSYDLLIQKAAGEANAQKRQELYDHAQRILCEQDVPIMPLFVVTDNLLVKPHVKNFDFNALAFVYLKKVELEP